MRNTIISDDDTKRFTAWIIILVGINLFKKVALIEINGFTDIFGQRLPTTIQQLDFDFTIFVVLLRLFCEVFNITPTGLERLKLGVVKDDIELFL